MIFLIINKGIKVKINIFLFSSFCKSNKRKIKCWHFLFFLSFLYPNTSRKIYFFLFPFSFPFPSSFPFTSLSLSTTKHSVKVQSQRRVKRGARSSSCIFPLDILKEDKICWSYLIIFSYTDFCIWNYIISKNIMGKQLIEHIITTKIAKRFLR